MTPARGLVAATFMLFVLGAFAVRASLDPSEPEPVQLGDFNVPLAGSSVGDLFLRLDRAPDVHVDFRTVAPVAADAGLPPPWTDLGSFRLVEGTARLRADVIIDLPALALYPGPSGERLVAARFGDIGGGAGLLFGYVDADNYWAVVAAPTFAAWQVWQVVDGNGAAIATLGPPALLEPGTEVAVYITADQLRFYLGGEEYLMIDESVDAGGQTFGLAALRSSAVDASWATLSVAAAP